MWGVVNCFKNMEKKDLLKNTVSLVVLGILLVVPSIIHAASLGFSPSIISRTIGSTFSVTIYVSSADRAMNAASGVISFPTDKLEVVSVSKTNSVMNLWVEEPTFSNVQGTVNFEGIALNPGYIGDHGIIITLTFRTKSEGQANVHFSSGSILANDGAGTDILEDLGIASFLIQGRASEAPDTSPSTNTTSDSTSTITSVTHSDQARWYSNNTPEFSWDLPDDALEVRTLIGKSSTGVPTVRYSPPVNRKKVDALPDGIYYFSLQIRTAKGWGGVERYRVNIDSTPPSPFTITFPHGNKGWEPQPVILFNTTDSGSGISKYDVKIGNGGPTRVAPSATSNPYPLPPQYPGTYAITVTAIDEAGNTRSATEDFTIEAIDAPVVTHYQDEIESGDIMKVRGTTYPDSNVSILIKDKNEVVSEEYTKSNSSGDWSVVVVKRLDPGVYTFTARVIDGRGAKSNETDPLTIIVNSKFLTNLINLVLNYLSAVILVFLVLVGVVGGGAFLWYRSLGIVRRLRRESREAEKVLEKSFHILRKDVSEHITRLKTAKSKRKLSSEEIEFLERFEEELAEANDIITKEVQDISHS